MFFNKFLGLGKECFQLLVGEVIQTLLLFHSNLVVDEDLFFSILDLKLGDQCLVVNDFQSFLEELISILVIKIECRHLVRLVEDYLLSLLLALLWLGWMFLLAKLALSHFLKHLGLLLLNVKLLTVDEVLLVKDGSSLLHALFQLLFEVELLLLELEVFSPLVPFLDQDLVFLVLLLHLKAEQVLIIN